MSKSETNTIAAIDCHNNSFVPFGSFPHPLQKSVMPLIAEVEGNFIPVGTAFAIHPEGLLMTARHVLCYAHDQGLLRWDGSGNSRREYGLYALYMEQTIADHQILGGLWPIDSISAPEGVDLALCVLRPAFKDDQRVRVPVVKLDLEIPTVGAKICGIGYHSMIIEDQGERPSANRTVKYTQSTALTSGAIVAVHPELRDQGMYRFPCFQTDARFDHGMSGGPVFGENGAVCGVVCGCLNGSAPDYVSYVSLLWPLPALPVPAPTPSDPLRECQLRQWMETGAVMTRALDRVSYHQGNDLQTKVSYRSD